MSNPRLLLLDEVSLGLAPIVVKQLYAALPAITASGATVLVVEQDMRQGMAVADRVHCLLEGRTVLDAHVSQVTADQVANAYFGSITDAVP
jgi:branched-chain amino acid transport system ATP-binding protein